MLKDADIGAGNVQLFDESLIVTAFRATMLETGNFTGDAVKRLQVFDEIIAKVRMSRGGSGYGVPTSMGSRISRSKARRCGVKPVALDGVDR